MQMCIMRDVSYGKMRLFSCLWRLESGYKDEKLKLCSGPKGDVTQLIANQTVIHRGEKRLHYVILQKLISLGDPSE